MAFILEDGREWEFPLIPDFSNVCEESEAILKEYAIVLTSLNYEKGLKASIEHLNCTWSYEQMAT